jgi:cellulose synthase/poly-beta-1,6-N-acetylglucosamine synthase-like glycosyltransferase
MTTLLLALAGLSLLLFIYPYTIYPLLLRLLPSAAEIESDDNKPHQTCALLFCAYNEEASLPAKLANIRALKSRYPDLEVLAYSDCSSDKTNELLQQASDVLTPVLGTQRLGKVLGMQQLINMSKAEVLVFTDANVIVEPESLHTLRNYFNDPNVGAVGCTLLYDNDRDEALTDTARVGGLYWRLEEHIKKLESRSGSMMGADGALFARRRAGYPDLPGDLVDDMAASIDVLFHGLRCVSAPDVIGYEQSVQSGSEEFKRKKRIACGSYSTYRFLRPQLQKLPLLERFKFLSHKVLRWWGATHLLATLVFFLLAAISAGLFMPALLLCIGGAGLFAIGVYFKLAPISSLWEILLAVVATQLGLLESLRGEKYQTWTPAQTR